MENKIIKNFIEQVKLESTYKKFLKVDIIYQLIDIFDGVSVKQSYSNEFENPLELVIMFYKNYNLDYYNMIETGIKKGLIVINSYNEKSYTETKDNKTFIKLYRNDGDVFLLVHELAHFIDRNSLPVIIPDKYWFLAETFAFYMERKFEIWLDDEKYKNVILTRKNNRLYFESRMLKAIENELYYEKIYSENGTIEEKNIDIQKINSIIGQNVSSNIVNYLLQYPLANVLSDFLISNDLIKSDKSFAETCLNIDLYEVLRQYSSKQKVKRF